MKSKTSFRIAAVLSALFLTLFGACGGGGGGGGSPPSPPPPGGDTTFGNLAITAGNADLLGATVSLAEGALAFTQAAVNVVVRFAGDGLGVRECGNTGSVSVALQDNDTSFGISPGDDLTLMFSSCIDNLVDGTVDGTITIAVTAFSLDATRAVLAGTIRTDGAVALVDQANPGTVISVTADHSFNFELQGSEVLSISAAGSELLTIEVEGVAETITEFAIVRSATRLSASIDTTTNIDLSYDSALFGGTFSCVSGAIAFQSFDDLPVTASLTCRGLNGSAARITNQNLASVDPEGDGTFTDLGIFDWNSVLDGFLKRDSGLDLGNVASEISLRRFAVRNNEVVYDPVRDRLLVTTKAVDPVYPSALVAVSVSAGTVSPLLTFVEEPNLVRVSDDGALIYVSFVDSGEIRSYDAGTLQQRALLEVTSDEAFSTTYGVVDMEVSPVGADRIAVAFQFLPFSNTDITLFDAGVQQVNSYRDAVGTNNANNWDHVVFTADGARVIAASTTSFGSAEILDLDSNGVASAAGLRNVLSGRAERYGNTILQGNTTFDGGSLVKVGTYPASVQASALDTVNNLALIISSGDLGVFRLDTYVPLATYDLGLADPDRIQGIVPAGGVAALREETTLHLVAIADIAIQLTGECDVVGLTTDENEALTNYACPIDDAVYDATRDKVYAATTSSLGVNGNSLVFIDRPTGAVEGYLFIGSEPRHLALSADGNLLYAIFQGADELVTVDLNTRAVVRRQQFDLEASIGGELEGRRALRIRASSTGPDTVIVSLGEPTSSPFERLTVFSNGTRLPDEVFRSDLQGGPGNFGPFVFFDEGGQPYSLNTLFPPNLQSLNLGPTGLSVGAFFEVSNVDAGDGKPDVEGSELFTSNGGVIDLASQSNETRYDTNASLLADGNAVNADVAAGNVYFLVGGGAGTIVARYDYSTGALQAVQAIEIVPGSFFEEKLIDIGADQLGIVTSPTSGLVVIDKAAVQ